MPRPRSCPIMPPMTNIPFTECDLLSAAGSLSAAGKRTRAQARPAAPGKARVKPAGQRRQTVAAGRRREITIGGRRVKTIDVHAHCVIPEAYALLGPKGEDHRGPGTDEIGPRRTRGMDAQGIAREGPSTNPRGYRTDADV